MLVAAEGFVDFFRNLTPEHAAGSSTQSLVLPDCVLQFWFQVGVKLGPFP